MMVSAGYNIAGPEVEGTLLRDEAVAECGVVGQPDAERGNIVVAYVVLKPGFVGDAAMVKALQEYVKAAIAPYKYPRSIKFMDSLPRKIGRASCRESVCPYVSISVVAVSLKRKSTIL